MVFPGSKIIRHYKRLAGPNAVCDGYLAGLSAIFVKTRPRVCGGKIPFPDTMARFDRVLDQRVRREEAELEREAAAEQVAARVRALADAERRREYGARYADAFSAFNVEVPPPIDGELPGRYRRRL